MSDLQTREWLLVGLVAAVSLLGIYRERAHRHEREWLIGEVGVCTYKLTFCEQMVSAEPTDLSCWLANLPPYLPQRAIEARWSHSR